MCVNSLPRSGHCIKFKPISDFAMLRKTAENPRVPSQTVQASDSKKNVKHKIFCHNAQHHIWLKLNTHDIHIYTYIT